MSVLFGSIFGLDLGQAIVAAVIGIALCVGVVCIARPLLFASVDESVAAARGLPVRVLGIGFLALVGVCAAEATQAVGALLLVGLVAAPAGAAHRLTGRPWIGLALSAAIAVGSVWLGLVRELSARLDPGELLDHGRRYDRVRRNLRAPAPRHRDCAPMTSAHRSACNRSACASSNGSSGPTTHSSRRSAKRGFRASTGPCR